MKISITTCTTNHSNTVHVPFAVHVCTSITIILLNLNWMIVVKNKPSSQKKLRTTYVIV